MRRLAVSFRMRGASCCRFASMPSLWTTAAKSKESGNQVTSLENKKNPGFDCRGIWHLKCRNLETKDTLRRCP